MGLENMQSEGKGEVQWPHGQCARLRSEGTLCCSWARHFTLTMPLSAQVYKRLQQT